MSSSGDPSIKQRKAALRKEVASRLQALDDAYIVEQVLTNPTGHMQPHRALSLIHHLNKQT